MSIFKPQRNRHQPHKPELHIQQQSYASFCNRQIDKDSPLQPSSFLNEQWAPLTTQELKRCLPEQQTETFDDKIESGFTLGHTGPQQKTTFKRLLERPKSNQQVNKLEALNELLRVTMQSGLTVEQAVMIDFGGLFREADEDCFNAALACYQSLMKQCIVKPQFIPIAIERAYRQGNSSSIIQFLNYLFAHHSKLYEQLAIQALISPNLQMQQAFMWSLTLLLATFGAKHLNYLINYMQYIKGILNKPEKTRLKDLTLKLLQQCIKTEGPDCIMSQLKDLPKEAMVALQVNHQDNLSISHCSGKEKSVSNTIKQPIVDPLKKYSEQWVNAVNKVSKQGDKVKFLEQLLEMLKECRDLSGQHKHLNNLLKQLLASNNTSIYIVAMRIVGQLARCIGRAYCPIAVDLLPILLTKFRDKKSQVSIEVNSCFIEFMNFMTLEEVLPIVQLGLADKNANMKVQTINFLETVIQKIIHNSEGKKQKLKHVFECITDLLQNTFEGLLKDNSREVRNATLECLRRMSDYLPRDKFPILIEAQRSPVGDNQTSRRATSNKHSSVQKEKLKSDVPFSSGPIVKLLVKINEESLSIEKKKQAIQQLTRIFLEGDASALMQLGCLPEVCSCLRTCLMECPKLLMKILIICIGVVYEKVGVQIKPHSKQMVHILLQSLKTQSVRRELLDTLEKVCRSVGIELFMSTICSSLQSDRSERAGILQFGIYNWQSFGVGECGMIAKGLVNCLNDKWQDVRQLAVELTNRLSHNIDFGKMRHIASRMHTKVPKELQVILSQIQQKVLTMKKPALNVDTTIPLSRQLFPINEPQVTNLLFIQKHSTQPSKVYRKEANEVQVRAMAPHPLLQENFQFDPVLSEQEWLGHIITFEQQHSLKQQMYRLFKSSAFDRLFSLSHNSPALLAEELASLCRAISHDQHLYRLYGLLMKWVLLRLWGGCCSQVPLLKLVGQIVRIMAEKRVDSFTKYLQLTLAILRQFLLAIDTRQEDAYRLLTEMIIGSVQLLTGQILLVAVLGQYQKDLTKIHPWVGQQRQRACRQGWLYIIKKWLLQYMADQLVMAHVCQMPDIVNDEEIINYLFERYPETELNNYGFIRPQQKKQQNSVPQVKPNIQSKHLQDESLLMADDDMILDHQQSKHTAEIPDPLPQRPKTVNFGNVIEQQSSKLQINAEINDTLHPIILQVPSEKSVRVRAVSGMHYRRITEELQLSLNTFQQSSVTSLFSEQLERLANGDIHSIEYFESMMAAPTLKVSAQLRHNADYLVASFVKLNLYMLQIRDEIPPTLLIKCYNLLLKTAKCKFVMQQCYKAMPYFIEFTLHQVVHEEQQRTIVYAQLRQKHPDLEDDCFIKVVNCIMMRIMENCPVDWLLAGLLTMAVKSVKMGGSVRLLYMIRRCVRRNSHKYKKEHRIQEYENFAVTANYYYGELQDIITQDDQIIKVLVDILRDLQMKYGEALSVAQSKYAHIKGNHSFMSEYGSYTLAKSRPLHDNELRLSNEAIHQIKQFQQDYPDFQPEKYLNDVNLPQFEHATVNTNSQTSSRAVQPPPNIFDLIRQQVQETLCTDISDDLIDEVHTASLRQSVKILRSRMDSLKNRIRQTQHL